MSGLLRKELPLSTNKSMERTASPIMNRTADSASINRSRSRIDAPMPPPADFRSLVPSTVNRSSSSMAGNYKDIVENRVERVNPPRSQSALGRVRNNNNSSPVKNRIDYDSPKRIREGGSRSVMDLKPIKRPSSVIGYKKQNSHKSPSNASVMSGSLPFSANTPSSHHHTTTTYNQHFNDKSVIVGPPNRSFISTTPTNFSQISNTSSASKKETINKYYSQNSQYIHSHQENERHVPTHLRNVDYSKANDVLEVVVNKINGLSASLPEAFRRIKQATGYTGGKVSSEAFKRALIKDFHLIEEVPEDVPNFQAVKRYQSEQVKKLDELIKLADPNGEGSFGYHDFYRAMEELNNHLGTNSTTAQRESRYTASMNQEAIRRRKEKNEQYIERYMDPKMERPPYGVQSDLGPSIDPSRSVYYSRMDALKNLFQVFGDNDRIPVSVFRETLKKFDRYILDIDVDQILDNLGVKKNGYVSVNNFLQAYGFETIKSKSFRASYEAVKTLQWPLTLQQHKNTHEKIQDLREKKAKKRTKVNNTRSNILRADQIKRENSTAMSGSRMSQSFGDRGSVSAFGSESGRSTPSFMKTPTYLLDPNSSKSIRLSDTNSEAHF